MNRVAFRSINVLGKEIEQLAYQVKMKNRP